MASTSQRSNVIAVGAMPLSMIVGLFVGLTAGLWWGLGALVFVLAFCWVGVVPVMALLEREDNRVEQETAVDDAPETTDTDATDPIEVLRARYAAGEIDETAFERGLEILLESESSLDPAEVLDRVEQLDSADSNGAQSPPAWDRESDDEHLTDAA